MPLAERLKLAEGRPLRRRMMAAMGQQDCGQCGYNCQDYADAIVSKKEDKAQSVYSGRQGDAAHAEGPLWRNGRAGRSGFGAGNAGAAQQSSPQAGVTAGRSRDTPAEAVFVSRTLLNKPGSGKQTWHIEFDLSSSGLDYVVGDCFGIFPTNDPTLVEAVIKALGVPADFPDRRTHVS